MSQILSKDYFHEQATKKDSDVIPTPALSSTFRSQSFDTKKDKFPNYLVGIKFNFDPEDIKNIEKQKS